MRSIIFQLTFLAVSTLLWVYDLNKQAYPGRENNKLKQKELKFGASIKKPANHVHSHTGKFFS
jgi:hypothetical protein